ncbi:hypothetical protein [Paraburkholderia diazotrophica]|uniref:hypothetical protein n=1 Tax=Paraburkholderia diazotrophica TaxID=667676 RepID=UPI0031708E68
MRAELYRMALSADAATHLAEALKRIADMLDRDWNAIGMHRVELRNLPWLIRNHRSAATGAAESTARYASSTRG